MCQSLFSQSRSGVRVKHFRLRTPLHVEKVHTKARFKHDFSNFNAEEFMDEIKESLNGMIINSDNPAAALDDATGAIKKVFDDHAPLKKCLELKGD